MVLFNKKVFDSVTYKCLMKNGLDKFTLIIDNSTQMDIVEHNKENICGNARLVSNEGSNIGLSAAYNRALSVLFVNDITFDDYICWLDDDTVIPNEFFKKQFRACGKGAQDIYLPIVRGQDGKIYSPNLAGKIKNKAIPVHTLEVNQVERINGINSCLTVHARCYDGFRYNERLFLDQVDQLFFDVMRTKKYSFGILDVEISQNFSQRSNQLGDSYKKRFIIRTKDIINYGRLSPNNNVFFSCVKNILLGIQFSCRTKSAFYLFQGFKAIALYLMGVR